MARKVKALEKRSKLNRSNALLCLQKADLATDAFGLLNLRRIYGKSSKHNFTDVGIFKGVSY